MEIKPVFFHVFCHELILGSGRAEIKTIFTLAKPESLFC